MQLFKMFIDDVAQTSVFEIHKVDKMNTPNHPRNYLWLILV